MSKGFYNSEKGVSKIETWFVIFLSISLIFIGFIISTLYSMAKRQDERQDYIKTKAMANTFGIVLGMLILEIIEDIYRIITENESYFRDPVDPYVRLLVICIIYFVSLLFYSRKHA